MQVFTLFQYSVLYSCTGAAILNLVLILVLNLVARYCSTMTTAVAGARRLSTVQLSTKFSTSRVSDAYTWSTLL